MLVLTGTGPRSRPATLPEGAPANLALEAVTEYVAADAAYCEGTRRLAQAREHLFYILNSEWERSVQEGSPLTTFNLPTVRGELIKVVFQERFRSLGVSDRAALIAAFGEEYSNLIEEVEELQFAPGVTLSDLETAIGKSAVSRLKPLLTAKERLRPRKGLIARLAEALSQGGKFADDLFDLVRATIAAPQIRLLKDVRE